MNINLRGGDSNRSDRTYVLVDVASVAVVDAAAADVVVSVLPPATRPFGHVLDPEEKVPFWYRASSREATSSPA